MTKRREILSYGEDTLAGRRSIILMLSILILSIFAWSQASVSDIVTDGREHRVLKLTKGVDEYPVGRYLEILEDKEKRWTFGDIISPPISQKFAGSNTKILNYGFTDSAYWVRLKLQNANHYSGHWRLALDLTNFNFVDAYIPNESGYRRVQTGNKRPFSTRDVVDNSFVFRVDVDRSESAKTIYLRFENQAAMIINLTLLSMDSYLLQETKTQLLLGLFYGALLIMLAYNFVLSLFLKEKGRFHYVFFLLAFFIAAASYDGFTLQYLSPFVVWPALDVIALSCALAAGLLLANQLLALKSNVYTLYIVSWIIIGLLCLVAIAFVILPYGKVSPYFLVLQFAVALYMLAVGAYRWCMGYSPAATYTISWIWYAAGNAMIPVSRWSEDLITQPIVWVRFGLIMQMIFLSLAVAERINRIRQEREEMQLELIKTQEKALTAQQKAEQLKDSFMSTITHELLTPINGIRLSHSLLVSEVKEAGVEYLSMAETSSRHMLHLVRSMIVFAEARRGSLAMDNKPLSVKLLIQTIFDHFKKSDEKNLNFELHIDKSVPNETISDEIKLGIIIIQLLKNAVTFTHRGDIKLACSSTTNEEGVRSLTVSVQDTGIGIDEENQLHIFDAFRQIDSSSTREHGGLGIGLTNVKDILNLFGGTLKLDSAIGAGSTFTFTIPISDDQVLQSSSQSQPNTQRKDNGEDNKAPRMEENRILVVEDNLVNMTLIVRVLENANYKVLSAANGNEALEVLKQHSDVAAILMDCQMPIMDGFTATIEIRKMDFFKDIPIIAVSANTSAEDQQRCWDAGMSDFLAKPVNKGQIKSMLRKWHIGKPTVKKD